MKTLAQPQHFPANSPDGPWGVMGIGASCEPWSDYGWIIWGFSERQDLIDEGHRELAALLKFCEDNDIEYLKLDCDASTIDSFPTFDW